MVTCISTLGLSQLPDTWLTQWDVVPMVPVLGVGAVVFPVPPVDVMYHKRLLPPAVSGVAVLPWQKDTGVTVGDARVVLTTTSICARGPSQLPVVALTQ